MELPFLSLMVMWAARSDFNMMKLNPAKLCVKLGITRDESGLHVTLPAVFSGKTALALKIQS